MNKPLCFLVVTGRAWPCDYVHTYISLCSKDVIIYMHICMYTHTHIFLIKLVSFREKKNLCSKYAFLLEVKSYIYCVSHYVCCYLKAFFWVLFSQRMVLMLHSAISTINNVGFVIKMVLVSAQDLQLLMLSQYDFYPCYWVNSSINPS